MPGVFRNAGWKGGRVGFAVLAPSFVLALILGVLGSSARARDFRVADTQVEDYPTVQALFYLDRLISERTRGRHSLRVFHSHQLGDEKETIEQTRAGAIDLNRTNVAPLGGFIPEANVLVLPFLFRSEEHLRATLAGPIGEEILASFEPYGFIGLTFYDSGARSIYNSVRPIRTPSDLKGLRVRVQQSDLMADMMRAFEAEPVALAYSQVLTALTTRLIDGAENNWPSYVTTDHYLAAPFYTLTEHTMSPEVLVISKHAWDSLTPEDRDIFRSAAKESSDFMHRQWVAWEEQSRKRAEQAGIVPIVVDKAPFQAAMTGVYERALGNAKARDLVNRIRNLR